MTTRQAELLAELKQLLKTGRISVCDYTAAKAAVLAPKKG